MRELLRRLFCRHDYGKIGWQEAEENHIRYSIRQYIVIAVGNR